MTLLPAGGSFCSTLDRTCLSARRLEGALTRESRGEDGRQSSG